MMCFSYSVAPMLRFSSGLWLIFIKSPDKCDQILYLPFLVFFSLTLASSNSQLRSRRTTVNGIHVLPYRILFFPFSPRFFIPYHLISLPFIFCFYLSPSLYFFSFRPFPTAMIAIGTPTLATRANIDPVILNSLLSLMPI